MSLVPRSLNNVHNTMWDIQNFRDPLCNIKELPRKYFSFSFTCHSVESMLCHELPRCSVTYLILSILYINKASAPGGWRNGRYGAVHVSEPLSPSSVGRTKLLLIEASKITGVDTCEVKKTLKLHYHLMFITLSFIVLLSIT